MNIANLAPYMNRHAPTPPFTHSFKVLQANVLTQNRDTALLEALIKREKPDIIVLAEINDAFRRLADDVRPQYPHQARRHKVAVLSRHAATDVSPAPEAYKNARISALAVTFGHQTIDVITLHTPTPLQNLPRRDAELSEAADFIRTRKNAVVFAGDINATLWCPAVRQFMSRTGLVPARRHHGIQPSWPHWLPASFLRIPIDHILADPRLGVADYRLGAPIGSDHLPTIGIFSLPDTQATEK